MKYIYGILKSVMAFLEAISNVAYFTDGCVAQWKTAHPFTTYGNIEMTSTLLPFGFSSPSAIVIHLNGIGGTVK